MTTADAAVRQRLIDHSRELILALQRPNGAYPASPDFSAYRGYCWFRDGAFIADGMSAIGEVNSASLFFDWCASIIERYEERIRASVKGSAAGTPVPDSDMLPARFTFAGELGADDWWDFQLDGYGTWLWALAKHAERHDLDAGRWIGAANLAVEYILASWQRPCFDWWEEFDTEVHVSTLGCLLAGLDAVLQWGVLDSRLAARAATEASAIRATMTTQGVADGHLTKWIGSTEIDASLASLIAPLRVVDPSHPLAAGTVASIERDLEVDRGIYRYRADTYFGGGRWPLLSCFVGLAHAQLGNAERAHEYLDWALGTATDDGDLPEQVGDVLLSPVHRQGWVDRWGTPATPLLWSHAMVLRLAAEVGLA